MFETLSMKALALPADWPPTLCVVVDTEEEFDWSAPFDSAATTTENIAQQPLAQKIMDEYGIVPAYVVDYPVANTPKSAAILREFMESGRCEVGAHLHPWVNPPHEEAVNAFHSFPGNLPPALERRKLEALTRQIETAFGRRPVIYKAGRYGLGPSSLAIMSELGYRVDVSVVPHTDFSGQSGPDFTPCPAAPFMAGGNIVALPLSVHFTGGLAWAGPRLYPLLGGAPAKALRIGGILSRAGLLERLRLSPEGHMFRDLVRQTESAQARGERYFMLTYHSSTLLPGAKNSYAKTEMDRQAFLATLERYFSFFLNECHGQAKPISIIADALLPSATG